MKNEVRVIDLRALYEETVEVYSHELDIRDQIGPKLFHYEATPEEAREWYHTFDPLNEGFMLELAMGYREARLRDPSMIRETIQNLSDQIVLSSRVGDILLGSVLLGEDEDYGKYFYGDGENLKLSSYSENLGAMGELLLHLSDISYEEVEDLSLAAEAYQHSGSQLLQNYEAKLSNIEGIDSREDLQRLSDSLVIIGAKIRGALLNELFRPEDVSMNQEELEALDSTRIAVLKNLVNFFDKPSVRIEAEGVQLEPLMFVMLSLQSLCMPNDYTTMSKRLKMPHLKGPLHELMWAIDAEMLRRMRPNFLGDIHVAKAHAAGDRPRIGRPKLYRSYDFMLTRGNMKDFVQLKSSPQSGKHHAKKQYHPAIWVLEEQNFMEVDPRRLTSKMRKYINFIEQGCPKEGQAEVRKYVMPSVEWMMNSMTQRRKSRGEQILESFRDHFLQKGTVLNHEMNEPRMNRQARRSLAKKNRKLQKN